MKVIALYLPQYHNIKENDVWWGKGYTEWTSVKRGIVLTENQYQPRIPQNDNYYNLLDIDVMKWQVELAKEHGIYGFCFYHYWFNGHLLLEKPLEQFLNNKEIDFPYYLCWANETWTTIWEGEQNPRVLMKQDYYDKEDVDKHFNYLLPYFKDPRYMKNGNKPILSIYNPIAISPRNLDFLIKRLNKLAVQEGFDGISFIYLSAESMRYMNKRYKEYFDYGVEYEPSYVEFLEKDINEGRNKYKKGYLYNWIQKRCPFVLEFKKRLISQKKIKAVINNETQDVKNIRDYDEEWNKVLSIKHKDYTKYIPGGFVDWDNTPRRGRNGKVILNASPDKFETYFEQLVIRAKEVYKTDTIVLFAWNEWSEGGYLEPDERYGDAYLKAIKAVLERN